VKRDKERFAIFGKNEATQYLILNVDGKEGKVKTASN